MTPQLIVLAGPNGAGKSTFYLRHLASSELPFLNPDELVARTRIDPRDAARILDAARTEMIERQLGFITETVFSDPVGAKLGMLRDAVAAGYEVTLLFIGIESVGLGSLRIDQRVAEGGHGVPRDRLARRFVAALDNLEKAIDLVPDVQLWDNSRADAPHRLVAKFERGQRTYTTAEPIPRWARRFIQPKKAKTTKAAKKH